MKKARFAAWAAALILAAAVLSGASGALAGSAVRYGTAWWDYEPEWSYCRLWSQGGNQIGCEIFFYRIANVEGVIWPDGENHGIFSGTVTSHQLSISGDVWFYDGGLSIHMNSNVLETQVIGVNYAPKNSIYTFNFRDSGSSGQYGSYSQEHYALAIQKLATRSGPGTQYSEPGTFNVKGQMIRILSKAYDSGGVLWVKCVIPYKGSTVIAWTGWKRFDHSTLDINTVPYE